MMTVTLINAGLPEDAFSILCDFCREKLPRRGIPYSPDGDYRRFPGHPLFLFSKISVFNT